MDMQHIMHNIDKVYLITSFAENDNPERLGLCKTAQETISQSVPCDHIIVTSQNEWEKAWRDIKEDCAEGIAPLIHLAMHGDIDGIHIQGLGQYAWSDLMNCLEEVNNNCNHQLVVFMQVCHGAHCLDELKQMKRPPFFIMLASLDRIDIGNTFSNLKYFYEKAANGTLGDAIWTYVEKVKASESFYPNINHQWSLFKKNDSLPNELFECLITPNNDKGETSQL